MKKRLAAFVATGVLTLGALAGTAGAADAAIAGAALAHGETCTASGGCYYWEGPFATSQACVNYVASIGALGEWDCEHYTSPWWGDGSGWYATSPPF